MQFPVKAFCELNVPKLCVFDSYGVFTLPETETDKKWAEWNCVEGVHTAQRQTPTQIHMGICANLSVSVLVSMSVSVSGNVNAPFVFNNYKVNKIQRTFRTAHRSS